LISLGSSFVNILLSHCVAILSHPFLSYNSSYRIAIIVVAIISIAKARALRDLWLQDGPANFGLTTKHFTIGDKHFTWDWLNGPDPITPLAFPQKEIFLF